MKLNLATLPLDPPSHLRFCTFLFQHYLTFVNHYIKCGIFHFKNAYKSAVAAFSVSILLLCSTTRGHCKSKCCQ